jgi:hypothetical protein
MPKNAKNKVKLKEKLSYTDSQLQNALNAIDLGEKAYSVAKKYNIPRSTIRNKIRLNIDVIQKAGRPSFLSPEDENSLEALIITNCERGHNPTMRDIMETVKTTLDKLGRKNVFTADNKPSYTWLKLFLQRHPRLKMKRAKYISPAACNVSEGSTRFWFKKVEADIKEEYGEVGLAALQDPARNFNQDESGLAANPIDQTLFFTFDSQMAKLKMFGNEKAMYSINLTTCADGTLMKTFLLLPYVESIPPQIRENIDLSIFDFIGGSGYETQESFLYYLERVRKCKNQKYSQKSRIFRNNFRQK